MPESESYLITSRMLVVERLIFNEDNSKVAENISKPAAATTKKENKAPYEEPTTSMPIVE